MRFVLGLSLGLIIGVAASSLGSVKRIQGTFLTAQVTALADEEGTQLGLIPEGRPILALGPETFEPDIGWWGCIPVLYSDGFKARDMLTPTTEWSADSGSVISAHDPSSLPARLPPRAISTLP